MCLSVFTSHYPQNTTLKWSISLFENNSVKNWDNYRCPRSVKNWLGLVNICVNYARQNRDIYQVLTYLVDFKFFFWNSLNFFEIHWISPNEQSVIDGLCNGEKHNLVYWRLYESPAFNELTCNMKTFNSLVKIKVASQNLSYQLWFCTPQLNGMISYDITLYWYRCNFNAYNT